MLDQPLSDVLLPRWQQAHEKDLIKESEVTVKGLNVDAQHARKLGPIQDRTRPARERTEDPRQFGCALDLPYLARCPLDDRVEVRPEPSHSWAR